MRGDLSQLLMSFPENTAVAGPTPTNTPPPIPHGTFHDDYRFSKGFLEAVRSIKIGPLWQIHISGLSWQLQFRA